MSKKRVAVIADMHCGHRAGLTPPNWRFRECSDEHIWKKFTRVQQEAWDLYMKEVEFLKPIDALLVNADCIDGRGEKSGGVELITGDRNEQCKMAIDCINVWEAPAVFMTRGTGYHTGDIESWEDIIAEQIKAKIGDHEFIDVNGFVIDMKHHVGSSQVPYGRGTAVAKDDVWNLMWKEAELQPRGDMILRSHVHYYTYQRRRVGKRTRYMITTPALQAMGTRFGARRCSGTVDWGVFAFDIDENGRVVWEHEGMYTLESTVATVSRV